MPDLSVIVPAHDVAPFLPTTLRSLEAASAGFGECIVVDDASTDGTGEVLDAAAGRLPWLRVVHHDEATGPSQCRNDGLAAASGRLVAFADADDWVTPDRFTDLAAAVDRLGVAFVRTDQIQVHGTLRRIVPAPEARRDRPLDPRSSILPVNRETMVDYPYSWAGVFDRARLPEGILRFDPALHTAEDRDWIWRLHLRAESYAVVPGRSYYYRRGLSRSLTSVGDLRQLDIFPAMEAVLRVVDADPEAARFRPKATRTYCAMLVRHYRLRARFTPAVRAEFFRRARARLRSFDPAELADTARGMGWSRRAVLFRLAH